MVLYPMFVHMYLELVYKGSEKEGKHYKATTLAGNSSTPLIKGGGGQTVCNLSGRFATFVPLATT